MKLLNGSKPEYARFRRAFTLLELLVVIMIIIVLAGITLRVTVYINRKMGENKSATDLERLKHALIEYHATYGMFPPVNRINLMTLPTWETMQWVYSSTWPNVSANYGCYTGLAYYLWSTNFEPDRQRWSGYIEGMDLSIPDIESNFVGSGMGGSGGWIFWTNGMVTCWDPWDRPYYYESFDPYQSFRLWSRGPDGVHGTPDDIGIQWSE